MKYLLLLTLIGCSSKFKLNDCVKDNLVFRTRKILYKDSFKYRYAIYFEKSKTWDTYLYSMRKLDFEKRMTKTNCPGEKND